MTQDANAERREIEKRLMSSVNAIINIGLDSVQWLDSQPLKNFTETLYELVTFHTWHGEIGDTVVGFEAVSAYMIVTGQLYEMLRDERFSDSYERIGDELDYITSLMQKIIAEGYSKMYYDERANKSNGQNS